MLNKVERENFKKIKGMLFFFRKSKSTEEIWRNHESTVRNRLSGRIVRWFDR